MYFLFDNIGGGGFGQRRVSRVHEIVHVMLALQLHNPSPHPELHHAIHIQKQ